MAGVVVRPADRTGVWLADCCVGYLGCHVRRCVWSLQVELFTRVAVGVWSLELQEVAI
jgi:hypothetical protein